MVGNGSERSSSGDDLVGRVLAGRYRVVDVVSRGANTIICAAVHVQAEQPVTFKIVQPELSESEEFRRDFRRRAELATALAHPNIAAVLDWGDVVLDGEPTVFWVVEHLGGGSLRDLFDRGRLLQPSQALVVGLEACRALDAAHQRGVAHTELTPSKLVFGADRRLRIVDFGMAELIGRSAWADPATVATHVARYASPEQALGLDVGPKTDVYALALCLLEAVTGKVPFASDSTVSTLAARVDRLMPVSADLGSLASVIERSGRPEADDRFTAAEFGRALVQAAETLPRPEPIPIVAAALFDSVSPSGTSDVPASVAPAVVAGTAAAGAAAALSGLIDSDPAAAEQASAADATTAPAGTTPVALVPDFPDDSTIDDPIPDHDGEGLVIIADTDTDTDTGSDADVATAPTAATAIATSPDSPSPSPSPSATVQMPVTAVAPAPVSELYDDERPKRRSAVMIMLALFVLAGVASVSFAAFYLLRTKSYEVPQLAGVEEAVALNEIAGNDWVVTIERERSDDEPDAGEVIRSFPLPGAVLEEGSEFTLFVSEGPLFRVLPDVTGQTAEEAAATLTALQLQSFVDSEEFDEVVAPGVVLAWRVLGAEASVAGDEVLPGTNIALTTSLGPAPRAVPNVVGLTLEDAQATAAAVQLTVVAGEDAFSDDVPVGVVISQDTAAGVELQRDSSFSVIQSKGPDLITLPDLTGLSYTAAQQALTDAGFTIGSLLGTTEGTFESISITAEPVGDQYRRGTSVDLIFL